MSVQQELESLRSHSAQNISRLRSMLGERTAGKVPDLTQRFVRGRKLTLLYETDRIHQIQEGGCIIYSPARLRELFHDKGECLEDNTVDGSFKSASADPAMQEKFVLTRPFFRRSAIAVMEPGILIEWEYIPNDVWVRYKGSGRPKLGDIWNTSTSAQPPALSCDDVYVDEHIPEAITLNALRYISEARTYNALREEQGKMRLPLNAALARIYGHGGKNDSEDISPPCHSTGLKPVFDACPSELIPEETFEEAFLMALDMVCDDLAESGMLAVPDMLDARGAYVYQGAHQKIVHWNPYVRKILPEGVPTE